jgi:hypothetical protein
VSIARAACCSLLVFAACASHGPERALDEYREAVKRKDAGAVHALSDASFRAAFDVAAIAKELEEARAVGEPKTSAQHATFVLESGETIELLFEDGAWKVTSGGIQPARFDTPERALESFFRAALAGKLAVVRAAIPKRFREVHEDDASLEKHLASIADRIATARTRLGPIKAGRAAIHGDEADLPYGAGLSVTFEKEGDRWVIVDLE